VVDVLLGGSPGLALNPALAHMTRWPTDALLATTIVGAFGLFALVCSPSPAVLTMMRHG
jgi:hypothetical protein